MLLDISDGFRNIGIISVKCKVIIEFVYCLYTVICIDFNNVTLYV